MDLFKDIELTERYEDNIKKLEVRDDRLNEEIQFNLRYETRMYKLAINVINFYTRFISLKFIKTIDNEQFIKHDKYFLETNTPFEYTLKPNNPFKFVKTLFYRLTPISEKIDDDFNIVQAQLEKKRRGSEEKYINLNSDNNKNFLPIREELFKKRFDLYRLLIKNSLHPIRFTFFFYITLKFLLIGFIQTKHELAYQYWSPSIRENASYSENELCVLKEDIVIEDLSLINELNCLENWLEYLGCPISSLDGTVIIIFFVVSMCPLIFYFSTFIIMQFNSLKVNIFTFYCDPIAERKRIKGKFTLLCSDLTKLLLKKLIEQQKKSEQESDEDSESSESSSLPHLLANENRLERLVAEVDIGHLPDCDDDDDDYEFPFEYYSENNEYSYNFKLNKKYEDKCEDLKNLIKLISKIHHVDLVRPANLSYKYHKYLLPRKILFLVIGSFNGFASTVMIIVFLTIIELYTRARERLAIVNCQKWNLNGTFIYKYIRLKAFESFLDEKAYLDTNENTISYDYSHNNNLLETFSFDLLYLGLKIESKYFFTPNVVICLIQIILLLALCGPLVCFYFSTYFFTYWDKSLWLKQLSEQTNHCVSLLIKHKHYSLLSEKRVTERNNTLIDANNNNNNNYSMYDLQSSYNDLIESLTISYLNYELFRRSNDSYQTLIQYTMIQFCTLTLGTFLLSYLVGTIISTGSKAILLLLSTYLLIIADVYILTGAIRTRRLEDLMKNVVRILACASINSMHLVEIIQLWRRQLMSETETRLFFAPKIFGIELSYKELIRFNIYGFALWLVLLKSNL